MKKLQNKNLFVSAGILLLSISSLAMLIPNALAQDTSTVTINATVEDGCDWTGDPYLSTSSLDVWDDEICVIQGTGREALNVYVHQDGDISGGGGSLGGQIGGKLIVGSTGDDTDFTIYGTVNFDGIVNVGNGTTHEYDATLATHSTNFNNVGVSNISTRSDGILTVIYNGTDNAGNTANNTVNFVNSQLNIGNTVGVTDGTFIHNDDSTTSYIYSTRVEGGAFNNLQGTLTINQFIELYGSSTFDNASGATLTVTGGNLALRETTHGDNSGTINTTLGGFRLGTSDETPTFTNAAGGQMNQPNANWFDIQGDFENNGTVTADWIITMGNGTTENHSGGIFDSSAAGGVFAVYDDDSDGNIGAFNNNSGGIVTTENTWVLSGTYDDLNKGTINNNDGATFTADNIQIGFLDTGLGFGMVDALLGGIFNNDGNLTVTGATGVDIFKGGKLNNLDDGTIDISAGDIDIGTDAVPTGLSYNNQAAEPLGNFTVGATITGAPSGATATIVSDSDQGTEGVLTFSGITGDFVSGDTITDGLDGSATVNAIGDSRCVSASDINNCKITNTNVNVDAFSVAGAVNMYGYGNFNNNGNMLISGANNIDIIEVNATVINGANGDLTLAGGNETFKLGVAVDNDGDITGSGPITFSDTASLDNASGASITNLVGGGGSIILDDTSYLTNAGTITISNLLRIWDDAYYDQSLGSITAAYLHLNDTTSPVSPYFTMTDGTADFSAEAIIYEDSTANVNGGTFTTGFVRVGEDGSQKGGTFNIGGTTGAVVLNSTTTHNHVYRGSLNVTSSADPAVSITDNGQDILIRGIAGDAGTVTHAGTGNFNAFETWIYEGGVLNINNGIWDNGEWNGVNQSAQMFVLSDDTTHGQLNIGASGELWGVSILNLGRYTSNDDGGTLTNNGVVARNGTPATIGTAITMYDGGKIDNYGIIDQYTSYLDMQNLETASRSSYVVNQPGGYIKNNGFRTYHQNQIIDNFGYMTWLYRSYIGYSGQGGVLNNGDPAGTTPGVLAGHGRLFAQYGGEINNHPDSFIGGIRTGTLNFDNNYPALKFDNESASFYNGNTIEGQTSLATADVIERDDDGSYGTLFLTNISGTFLDDEIIEAQGAPTGEAQVNGTLISNENFLIGDTITGQYYGSTAIITDVVDNGTSGTLTLSEMDGAFQINAAITGTTQGSALVLATLYLDNLDQFTISGEGINGNATFNQFEGTDAGNQVYKVNTDQFITGSTDTYDTDINIADYIKTGLGDNNESSKFNVITVDSTPLVDPKLGTSTTQDAHVWSTGSYTNDGELLIEGSATDRASWYSANTFTNNASATLTNNGLVETSTSQNNFKNSGTIYSGVDSEFIFPGISPGFELLYGGFAEFAGTVTASSIEAIENGARLDYDSRAINYFYIGHTLTGPTGTAIIRAVNQVGSSTSGSLVLEITSGSFSNGQAITSSNGTTATATSNGVYAEPSICFGDYTGGNCTHSSTNPLVEFTAASGSSDFIFSIDGLDVDIYNNMNFINGDAGTYDYLGAANSATITQGADSFIDFQDDTGLWMMNSSEFISNGNIDIQGTGAGAHGHAKLTERSNLTLNSTTYNFGSIWLEGGPNGSGDSEFVISASSTLNLNDTHNVASLSNAAITVGVEDLGGSEDIYLYGTLNLNSGAEQNIYLGADSPVFWNVDGIIVFDGGSLQHAGITTGTLDINQGGILYVGDDGTAAKDVKINGPTIIGGNYGHDQNGPHGAYIDGDFECKTSLLIENDGLLDISLNGDVVVTGSITTVNGLIELDGTLTPGDLTVSSTGIISSGDGADPFGAPTWPTYQGCGPNGVFGCGTTTNFFIDADSLNVELGGAISSDGVSTLDSVVISTIAHGGSYGGEGVANGTPEATIGAAKATSPLYGDQGEEASDYPVGMGGGGVNINVTGDITVDGTISANAGPATYDLTYASQTNPFTIGAILTGPTGTATIIADSTTVLTINILTGSFSNAQAITDNAGGGATTSSDAIVNESTGAGGTVIINQTIVDANTIFDGSGTITANGSNSTYSGGGGRIVIDSILLDDPDDLCGATHPHYLFTGDVEAKGGDDTTNYAAAGTIAYLGDINNPNDTLIVDQDGAASDTGTQVPVSSYGANPETEINLSYVSLGYDAQTADFNVGTTLTGGTSTATATIIHNTDNGTTGSLFIQMISGTFQDNETITDDGGSPGSATSDGNPINDIFARVDARDAAVITYETNPATNPTSCFEADGGSTITGPTCAALPDKPDTMNLHDSYAGAQNGCGIWEPSKDNPATGIYSAYPVMSFVYRNPEDSSTVTGIHIQVADDLLDFDDAGACTNCLWDAQITGLTQDDGSAITPGDRTEDIAYAGTALNTGTPYYVRAAFYEPTNTTPGLWSHLDIDDYYQFQISGSMTIADGCSGAINLTKDGLGVDDPSTANGSRYATESCPFTVTSDYATWQILFGLDPSNSAFENAGQTADIDAVDNAGADCNLTTDGTGTEEEYGFNLSSLTGALSVATEQNDCAQPFNSWNGTSGDYVFNIESTAEQIMRAITTTLGSTFDLNIHSTINTSTSPDDYSVDVRAIITTNP